MAEGKKDRGFVLGDISPLAGLVSGEGITSNLSPIRLMQNLKSGNMRGMPGEEEEEVVAVKKGPGMKRGGKVGGDMPFFASKAKDKMASKKKPARKPKTNYASGGMVKGDGCVMRGKTKGKNY
jgi:hypothetical protein